MQEVLNQCFVFVFSKRSKDKNIHLNKFNHFVGSKAFIVTAGIPVLYLATRSISGPPPTYPNLKQLPSFTFPQYFQQDNCVKKKKVALEKQHRHFYSRKITSVFSLQ